MTLPPLAIFIGRPLWLVKVVSSEIPSEWQTVAIKSSEDCEGPTTLVPSSLVAPTAIPEFIPAPPTTALQLLAQWSRPVLPLILGVRLNSPIQITATSSSMSRAARSSIRALIPRSSSGSFVFSRVWKMFWWLSQPPRPTSTKGTPIRPSDGPSSIRVRN